jgi:hypothetical protein
LIRLKKRCHCECNEAICYFSQDAFDEFTESVE